MYVTEQPENKFRSLHNIINLKDVIHQIQELEFLVNLESPRTQKAVNNLGLSRDMLMRRTLVEFQRKNEDLNRQKQRFTQHLFDLRDNLSAVVQERENIKRILQERKLEELGTTQNFQRNKRRDPLEVLSLDMKYQKLDREKEREQMIRENAAKDEIIKELRRRKTLEIWDKKIEVIQKTKERNLEAKIKAVSTKNLRTSQINQKHKEQEQEMINEKFTLSQTFSEKFIPRIQKISELKQKKIEELISEKDKRQEQIQIQRLKMEEKRLQIDQIRQKREVEQELRYHMEKESYKNKLSVQKMKQEQYLHKVLESAQMQSTFAVMENINSFGQKMSRRDSNLEKKNEIVEQFLKKHKKVILDKFTKQKERLDKINEKNEYYKNIIIDREHLEELEEESNQRNEQIQKFLEIKVIESNVKYDINQQKQKKQSQLLEKQLKQQKMREQQILFRSQQKQERVRQLKQDNQKLMMHTGIQKQKSEMESLLTFNEIQNYKYKPSDDLLQQEINNLYSISKLQQFNYIKKEELEAIKQEFFTQPAQQSALKSASQSQTNFFPQ